jgi:alpha-ketoglutarate-dependent taurine dioxygenase
MAPALVEAHQEEMYNIPSKATAAGERTYLTGSGLLESKYKLKDLTPIIGTEIDVKLDEVWESENRDEILKEIAIKISQRGVCFFRSQDGLTADVQKNIMQRMGELTGKPSTSRLHIHPIWNNDREDGTNDPEISTISSVQTKKFEGTVAKKQFSAHWHTDIAFEPNPAEYTSLRLTELPAVGGDTLWASGYELYDRISHTYQKFLDGLNFTAAQPGFKTVAARMGVKLYDGQRGAPANIGDEFKAIHPVVRTNAVTGWKSVYPIGFHVDKINDVSAYESKALLDWFMKLIIENHDMQVRFKYENRNDMAIWDNRCVFHTATFDLEGQGERFGVRAVGIGEQPFYDPNSKSRREALGQTVDLA